MKRLIFLIWLLMPVIALANNSNVVIGDSTFFNYTHTTAIDSAQLILIRGAVKDTLSLMPIVGSNHKMVEWENIFNHVDSAGTYQVWIESYNDDAIIDTILGVCQVELAARDVNVVQISGDVTAANNFETMLDGTSGQILSLRGLHIRGTTGADTALIAAGYGAGMGGFFYGGATNAHGLYAAGQGSGYGARFVGGATNGHGLYAAGQGSGDGARFYGGGTSGDGLYVVGQGSGYGARFVGGATNGHGLYAAGQGSGDGARFYGGGTNGDGLSLTAQGTGLDLNATITAIVDTNSAGDSLAIQPEYWTAADTAAYRGEAAGLTAQEVIDSMLAQTNADTVDGSMFGYLVNNVGGGAGSVPDSLLEIINEIKALATLAGVGDSIQVRYIDDDGTDADGLTPATAWDNFDSVKTLTAPTVVLVSEGTYASTVCSVEVSGISIIGVDGPGVTFVRGTADTVAFATERVFNINPGAEAILKGFRLSGLNIAHRVPNTAEDPGFKNAVFFSNDVEHVWIENCVFPDSNYKTIAGGVVTNIYITGCTFYGNKIHSIDYAGKYGRIWNNLFFSTVDTASVNVWDAVQLTTGAKAYVIDGNYFVDHQNAIGLTGADSILIANNYFALSSAGNIGSASSPEDITVAGNWGGNQSRRGLDASGNQRNTVEEEMKDFREMGLMNPLPGSIIPNGHLQVDWNADSTDIAGYAVPQGVEFYLTSRRAFEGYERSFYAENASLSTLKMKLDTGYYEMAAQIWFANSTTDTAFFQCYNSANDPQAWLSSGIGIEYAVGWTGWRRFARLIRLTGDSTFYFTIGANAGDSAYFAEVSLVPYGAMGHTIIATSGDGGNACSIYVKSGSDYLQGVHIRLRSSGGTDYYNKNGTNSDGLSIFSLNDGTYYGYATVSGHSQDVIPDTFTFTADYNDTLLMTAHSVSAASAPNLVNAYIYTFDLIGDTVVGARMEITPNGIPPFRDTDSNVVMIPRLVSSHSNTDGLVQQEIVRSSEATDLNGNNVTYNFKITKGNYFSALFENRTAPDSASWQIK